MIRHTSTQRPNDLFFTIQSHVSVSYYRTNKHTPTDRREPLSFSSTQLRMFAFSRLSRKLVPQRKDFSLQVALHSHQPTAAPAASNTDLRKTEFFISSSEHLFFPSSYKEKPRADATVHVSPSLSLSFSWSLCISFILSRDSHHQRARTPSNAQLQWQTVVPLPDRTAPRRPTQQEQQPTTGLSESFSRATFSQNRERSLNEQHSMERVFSPGDRRRRRTGKIWIFLRHGAPCCAVVAADWLVE